MAQRLHRLKRYLNQPFRIMYAGWKYHAINTLGLVKRTPGGISFRYRGRTVRLLRTNIIGRESMPTDSYREIFLADSYGWLDARGKTVFDIGGNIGDSAVYFAVNGARRIVSLEPFPAYFSALKRNLKANGVARRVVALNEGVGRESIRLTTGRPPESDILAPAKEGVVVRLRGLGELLDRFAEKGVPNVLKMDCEGAEYYAIMQSSAATLRRFGRMQIEYHFGVRGLAGKLEAAGFRVRVEENRNAKGIFGYIFAERDA